MSYGCIIKRICKPDNYESQNSLKLSFTNICGLCLNFVECESFLESNFPDILTLCETNLDDSINSGNFSVTGYLSLMRRDSITHMHGLAVYVEEGLPFAWFSYIENSTGSYLMFSACFTSLSVLLPFPLSISFFVYMNGFLFYFI